MSSVVREGFGGPGGWAVAMQRLGMTGVGFEIDEAACATPPYDQLGADCPRPWCRARHGEPCVTAARTPAGRLHAPRRYLSLALAAHADPELKRWFKPIGQCQVCGVPGLDQQHRIIDAIAGQLAAPLADPDDDQADWHEDVAAEFGVSVAAVAAVQDWMAKWPGAW